MVSNKVKCLYYRNRDIASSDYTADNFADTSGMFMNEVPKSEIFKAVIASMNGETLNENSIKSLKLFNDHIRQNLANTASFRVNTPNGNYSGDDQNNQSYNSRDTSTSKSDIEGDNDEEEEEEDDDEEEEEDLHLKLEQDDEDDLLDNRPGQLNKFLSKQVRGVVNMMSGKSYAKQEPDEEVEEDLWEDNIDDSDYEPPEGTVIVKKALKRLLIEDKRNTRSKQRKGDYSKFVKSKEVKDGDEVPVVETADADVQTPIVVNKRKRGKYKKTKLKEAKKVRFINNFWTKLKRKHSAKEALHL